MKYMLLIHQGSTPTPRRRTRGNSLSEEEQGAVYAAYKAHQRDPRRDPRPAAAAARDGDDRAGAGRQDADHRRPVRRDQGGDRRLPPVRGRRPRRRDRAGRADPGGEHGRRDRGAPDRRSGSRPRTGLPRPVGPRPRCADRLPRRLRPRRGSRAGGLRDRRGALAARRRAQRPRRLADHDGAQPGDRPHPPRSHAGREDAPARGARGGGGPRGRDDDSPTSGSSSSSPAVTRRSRPRRRSRSRCGRSAA